MVIVVVVVAHTYERMETSYVGGISPAHLLADASILYQEVPHLLGQIAQNQVILVAMAILLLAQWYGNVAIAQDIVLMYQHRRSSAFASLRQVTKEKVLWYCCCAFLANAGYGVIAVAAYLVSYVTWGTFKVNVVPFLVVVLVLLFPILYAVLSFGSKIATLPMAWATRMRFLSLVFRREHLKAVYLFFSLRLLIETVLLSVMWGILSMVGGMASILSLLLVLPVALPLAILRGSTLELLLDILRDDSAFRGLFSYYYNSGTRLRSIEIHS